MSTRMVTARLNTRRRRALVAAVFALALPIAACSSGGSSDSSSSTSAGAGASSSASSAESSASGSSASESSGASEAKTGSTSDVNVEVSTTENINPGDTLDIHVTGLDTKQGYYAAICGTEKAPGSPAPACTGEHGDTAAQAWLKTEGGTTPIAEDGSAHVTLTATPTGQGVDCTTQACVVKIFGDHSEGFKDVAEVPVTFAGGGSGDGAGEQPQQ